jgi:hypothetical protein
MEAQEWVAAHPQEINRLEQAFLETSIAACERERAEREAQRQRELAQAQTLAETRQRKIYQQKCQLCAETRLLGVGLASIAGHPPPQSTVESFQMIGVNVFGVNVLVGIRMFWLGCLILGTFRASLVSW